MQRLMGWSFLMLSASVLVAGGPQPDDPAKWLPIKIRGTQKVPEFADVAEWINSEPLTRDDLKGKVVVVHFMAADCINCVRNYPWYKAVWTELKDKDVLVLGIHTPETEGEKDSKSVRKKFDQAGLTFPIAIDNEKTMWGRYRVLQWPSIFLIDKKGIVRWAWRGELAGKGAKGETLLLQKIEALLKE